MKYLITESQVKIHLKELLEKLGMSRLSKMVGLSPKQIISMVGITGSKEDMLYLAKIIMDKDFRGLGYCSYQIIPTQHSFDLVMFTPEPAPENKGKYMYEEGTISTYRDVIAGLLFKNSTGLIRGYNVEVYNTGKC